MYRDVSFCNSYNYGDAMYWDARYVQEAEIGNFDWYQRYSALRPFIHMHLPNFSSHILMVGCGNALISEDMVKDGYQDIMNTDISSVAIDMMRRKYEGIPQLKYMQMDARDMSFFSNESFDGVIDKGTPFNVEDTFKFNLIVYPANSYPLPDKFFGSELLQLDPGTLDSLMCGIDAPISAAQMLSEVSRLLKPGGIYMLITYGDPSVRMPHLNRPGYNWQILLYIIPRPGFKKVDGTALERSPLEPVPLTDKGLLLPSFVMEDPDSHFIYVCKKKTDKADLIVSDLPTYPLITDTLL